MGVIWVAVALFAMGLFIVAGARWAAGRKPIKVGENRNNEELPRRDLNANVNPSQLGNEVDLWPDRTGPRTRRELGARQAADVTFVGDREEQKGAARAVGQPNQGGGATTSNRPANSETAAGPIQSDSANPAIPPGVRREVSPGPHEHGPGTASANLAPEDEFGEDRPANRTTAPDQPPTQWHPKDHGVPGDHIRDGHLRSATAPITTSDATDPYAHAPVPGPNHIIPEGGQDLPPQTQP